MRALDTRVALYEVSLPRVTASTPRPRAVRGPRGNGLQSHRGHPDTAAQAATGLRLLDPSTASDPTCGLPDVANAGVLGTEFEVPRARTEAAPLADLGRGLGGRQDFGKVSGM